MPLSSVYSNISKFSPYYTYCHTPFKSTISSCYVVSYESSNYMYTLFVVCELSVADQGVGGEKAWGVASSLILAENDVVYETEGKSGVIGNTPLICMHDYL